MENTVEVEHEEQGLGTEEENVPGPSRMVNLMEGKLPGYTPGPMAIDVLETGELWKEEVVTEGQGMYTPICQPDADYLTHVIIHYSAQVLGSNKPYEDTWTIYRQPIEVNLNNKQFVKGLQLAIQTMKIGEKAVFFIAARYMKVHIEKYGDNDDSEEEEQEDPIPDGSVVKVLIHLLDWYDVLEMGTTRRVQELNDHENHCFFPEHKALVEAQVQGKCNGVVFYPRKEVKFFIGDADVENLPIGLEAAMVYFQWGEKSQISIVEPKLMLLYGENKIESISQENDGKELIFEVELKRFQNHANYSKEKSIAERIYFCRALNETGKTLYNLKKYARAMEKFKDIKHYLLDGGNGMVLEEERLNLLFQAYIGSAKCFLKKTEFESTNDAIKEANKALKLQPNSVDALMILGKSHLRATEPDKGLNFYLSAQAMDPKNSEIGLQILNCKNKISELRKQKAELALRLSSMFN